MMCDASVAAAPCQLGAAATKNWGQKGPRDTARTRHKLAKRDANAPDLHQAASRPRHSDVGMRSHQGLQRTNEGHVSK